MTRRAVIIALIFAACVVLFHVATRPVPVSVKVEAGLEEAAKRIIEEHRRTQQ